MNQLIDNNENESLLYWFYSVNKCFFNGEFKREEQFVSKSLNIIILKSPSTISFKTRHKFFNQQISVLKSKYPLKIEIKRDNVFHDSFKSIYNLNHRPDLIIFQKWDYKNKNQIGLKGKNLNFCNENQFFCANLFNPLFYKRIILKGT